MALYQAAEIQHIRRAHRGHQRNIRVDDIPGNGGEDVILGHAPRLQRHLNLAGGVTCIALYMAGDAAPGQFNQQVIAGGIVPDRRHQPRLRAHKRGMIDKIARRAAYLAATGITVPQQLPHRNYVHRLFIRVTDVMITIVILAPEICGIALSNII